MDGTINAEVIRTLGITLKPSEEKQLLKDMEQELEVRIGEAIVELLDDVSLKELVKITETGDQDAVKQWVMVKLPDYEAIVTDEYDILLGELAEGAETLSQNGVK